jgi:hypothetical protein
LAPFRVQIRVTDGCRPLSRDEAIGRALPHYPIPPPQTISAKLMHVSQYEHIFATPLNLAADTLVWGVLTADPVRVSPASTPAPIQWIANAVDTCTDWKSWPWGGVSEPADWRAEKDLSMTGGG